MSNQIKTPFCFHCQHHPGPDDTPLKRCSNCRSRHYCSAECQCNDWPKHKQECRALAAGEEAPVRTRATMRINGTSLMRPRGEDAEPDTETIYHVKTSKPHIHDISISGPFYPLETVLPQLLKRLRTEKSTAGEEMLDNLVYDVGFPSMEHINAPLPDGNVMKLQLLREKNAEVARSLPCAVWKVIIATPIMTGDESTEHPTVKEMEVYRTYLAKAEANMAAERLLVELKKKAGSGAVVNNIYGGGLVSGFLISPGGGEPKIVQVSYDDCSVRDT